MVNDNTLLLTISDAVGTRTIIAKQETLVQLSNKTAKMKIPAY